MTRAEIEKRINELKKEDFYINTNDFLTREERSRSYAIGKEIIRLEKELREMN